MKHISDIEKYQIEKQSFDCMYEIDENKQNCVIFSNCHGLVIAELLRTVPEFNSVFNIYLILGYLHMKDEYKCLLNEDIKNRISILMKNCDLFLYQKAYKHHDFFSTYDDNENALQKLAKPECKMIVLTNVQNSGLWSLHFPKDTTDDILMGKFTESCEIFKQKDLLSDTPVYEYFINNFKLIKLFIDRAHPSIHIFIKIVEKVLEKLHVKNDIIFDTADINPCNLLGGFPHSLQDVRVHGLKYVTLNEIIHAENFLNEIE